MVYITGDTHGDISLFKNPKLRKLTDDDILLVCGDFGFLWDGSEKEKAAIEKLSKKKYTICASLCTIYIITREKHKNIVILHK